MDEGATPPGGLDPELMDRFIEPLSTLVSRYWEAAEVAQRVVDVDGDDLDEQWLVMLGGASVVDKSWLKSAQQEVADAHSEFWSVISEQLLAMVQATTNDDDQAIRSKVAGALYWQSECPGLIVNAVLDPTGGTKATSKHPVMRGLAPVRTVQCLKGHSFEWRQVKRSERRPGEGACPICQEHTMAENELQELDAAEVKRVRTQRLADGMDPERLQHLRTMPYWKYLQTPEWRATALAAKKRAGFKCSVCGSRKRLETHHNDYANRGCEPDEDLAVLCRGCHQLVTDNVELVKDWGPRPTPSEESPEVDDAE